jgi:hypothetical protein
LQNDELPVAGIVKQQKEMIENRNRESASDVVPDSEDIDESVRMNKETLKLICRVGESLLNSPRDSEASSTDEERLRPGFVRNIARELEMKAGVYECLQKVVRAEKRPIPFDLDDQELPVLERWTQFQHEHSNEFKRLGSLPDMRQCVQAANRPSSLCVESRAVHSAGEEEEVTLRRHSVGTMKKTSTSSSKPQRQVRSLVDKFETPSTSPKGLSPSRMDTDETTVSDPAKDLPASPESKMDISPDPSPSSFFTPERSPESHSATAEAGDEGKKEEAVVSKPPLPTHSLGTWLSPCRVRKHHGKTHPLEKLSTDTTPSGRSSNPLYNTM